MDLSREEEYELCRELQKPRKGGNRAECAKQGLGWVLLATGFITSGQWFRLWIRDPNLRRKKYIGPVQTFCVIFQLKS